ncbi:hypothetical protein K461DRAFT_221379 [Myriangium duriaei CBS 260.36]|uniref:Nitrogen permease regulator 3 n=1 Tax=Myriangium duriaei CBS 260.36 TaxID=1168546 RepID=A0A9P4JBY1_9PEZI|nr:hypothetical protein K461DRAFT_221379 [Myriangium duriaei CBS 260.36]
MSSASSDPALLALILTIRTRSGPRIVFHYPAHPTSSTPHSHHHHRRHTSLDTQSSTSSSTAAEDNTTTTNTHNPTSDTEDVSSPSRGDLSSKPARKTRTLREEGPDEYQDEYYDDDDLPSSRVPAGPTIGVKDERPAEWEVLLGFPTSALSRLLCPAREARKKRFEVGVGDVVFLGYPTFVRDDGGWRKGGRKSRTTTSTAAAAAAAAVEGARDIRRERLGDELAGSPAGSAAVTVGAGSFGSQGGVSEEAKSVSAGSDGESGGDMAMYHVVFVMAPSPLQHQAKIADMYENVVKKFAKALKYEQARTGYVWAESRRILDMKSRGKEDGINISILWPQIMQASTLARSIAHIYTAISASKIAHVSIGETVDASMQIPWTMSTSNAPTPADPQTPGLWVTTASMLEEDGTLSPHAALLLLEEKETLLKEIESDNRELAAPLGYFIRELTPTKSLQKMAIRLSLRLPDLQFLARHLIYWRRARAIPPLHIRDIYIVSPLADMRSFSAATEAFERRFPGLPSLPRILQSLSSRPLPYGYLIPSQDHKPVYMDILAWLLRGNWVTQLRTFAWVRVSTEIKTKAAIQAKKEEQRGSAKGRSSKRDSTASGPSGTGLERQITNDSYSEDERSRGEKSAAAGILSPLLNPVTDASKSDAGSVGSNRTAVQVSAGLGPSPLNKVAQHEAPSPLSINGKTVATEDDTGTIPPLDLAAQEPSVILAPQKASTEESHWLSLIRDSLSDEDLQSAWPTLSMYFDGQWALEDVAAREGMKRSRVANLVARLEREGVLCIARHW